jgi:hypothetical protein
MLFFVSLYTPASYETNHNICYGANFYILTQCCNIAIRICNDCKFASGDNYGEFRKKTIGITQSRKD